MSSAFWSELAKLDDSLLAIQSQVDWMRAGFEFDDDQLMQSLTKARQHGATVRDLVRVERADAEWSDRESLERLIHELEVAAQERRNQQRRNKLLELANELDAGTVTHRLEARATALVKLRQEAVKQLRTEATAGGQVKDLPGPAAGQWLHWACNLQEEKDGFILSRLRRDFAAVERFVAAMEESYWVPGKVAPESLSQPSEGPARPKTPSSSRGAPVFATDPGQGKPAQGVRSQVDQVTTRTGSNGEALTVPHEVRPAESASLTETLRHPEPATRWQAATAAVGNGASKLAPPRLNYCEQCGSSYRGEFHVCPVDSSVAREAAAAAARDNHSKEHAGDRASGASARRAGSQDEAAVQTSEAVVDSSAESAGSEFERLKALVGDGFSAVEDDEAPRDLRRRWAEFLANKRMVAISAVVAIIALGGILALVLHYTGRSNQKPVPPPQTVSAKVPDVIPDADIQKNIEQQMETLKGSSIQVAVQAGVVTLTGKTASKADLVKAETLAAESGGVKQVTNKIQVEAGNGKGRGKRNQP